MKLTKVKLTGAKAGINEISTDDSSSLDRFDKTRAAGSSKHNDSSRDNKLEQGGISVQDCGQIHQKLLKRSLLLPEISQDIFRYLESDGLRSAKRFVSF